MAPFSGEVVIEHGGDLEGMPARPSVELTSAAVTVWGLSDVPDGSRLQMALAGVDAITRSELLKCIEVRISAVVTSVESTDARRRSVVVETLEAVDGVLARGAPLRHGWARVRRGSRTVLRVWARLSVPREALETAARSILSARGPLGPSPVIDQLTVHRE